MNAAWNCFQILYLFLFLGDKMQEKCIPVEVTNYPSKKPEHEKYNNKPAHQTRRSQTINDDHLFSYFYKVSSTAMCLVYNYNSRQQSGQRHATVL